MSKHLVVYITGHGFGHVAQTAPVLNELTRLLPDLKLTLCTNVAESLLRSRIKSKFSLQAGCFDLGMAMNSALDVDVNASRLAYQKAHQNWVQLESEERQRLQQLQADLVLTNVSYLPLAAAQSLNIPNIAFCSLNWCEIYRHYCGNDEIATHIHQCYEQADAFFATTPAMPMAKNQLSAPWGLTKLHTLAPIAATGIEQAHALKQQLGLSEQDRLVLISLGGINSRINIENWPRIPNVKWLVQQSWQIKHPDAYAFEPLGWHFSDLLASCDALLTKPGYGSYIESSCSGIPVIYVDRPDWPESPALNTWLKQYNRCIEVTRTQLENGQLSGALMQLWQQDKPSLAQATGSQELAHYLAKQLTA